MVPITQNGVFPPGSLARTHLFYPPKGTSPRGTGRMIRTDIQAKADALALAFSLHFRKPLDATDGARDLATQYAVWDRYINHNGAPAAIPGTSNHGWAAAFDLASNINSFGTPEHEWMRANAAKFGFKHPYWARQGGGRAEAWHWEYVGGGVSSPRVLPERAGRGEVGIGHTNATKVREIQTRLNYHLPTEHHVVVDGDYGYMTAVAVVRFQMAHRAYVSGRVSLLLLARLRSDVETTRYERALRRLREMRARARARLERAQDDA